MAACSCLIEEEETDKILQQVTHVYGDVMFSSFKPHFIHSS